MKKQTRQGFTIVELLIVIVVIAILAAITIVAYNGIQERARMSAAKSFESQLRNKYLASATGNWSFDDCSGSSVKNNAGPMNSDPIAAGTATWINDTPSGSGCALHFDGATRIETQASLGTSYYVKGAWVRVTAASCGSYNVVSQAATNGAVAAFYLPGCKPNAGNNGSWGTVASATAINDGKWHYVATEWMDGMQKLYVDGTMVASAASPAVPTNATGFVSIGSHAGGNYMVGDIDNVFVAAE